MDPRLRIAASTTCRTFSFSTSGTPLRSTLSLHLSICNSSCVIFLTVSHSGEEEDFADNTGSFVPDSCFSSFQNVFSIPSNFENVFSIPSNFENLFSSSLFLLTQSSKGAVRPSTAFAYLPGCRIVLPLLLIFVRLHGVPQSGDPRTPGEKAYILQACPSSQLLGPCKTPPGTWRQV